MPDAVLFDAASAAVYLGMTEENLRSKVQRRQVPFVRIGKRSIRFDRRQLDQWIKEHTTEAAS